MFIRYQTVRNSAIGAFAALASAGLYFSMGKSERLSSSIQHTETSEYIPSAQQNDVPENKPQAEVTEMKGQALLDNSTSTNTAENVPIEDKPTPQIPQTDSAKTPQPPVRTAPPASATTPDTKKAISNTETILVTAMKIAQSPSTGRQGKDILGPSSPWKINLYDDDENGTWDRGKVDNNRDEIDDEKWVFKNGLWEKDDGKYVWKNNAWAINEPSKPSSKVNAPTSPNADTLLNARYAEAMKIATSPSQKGKGKDVLGSKHPWKLNLYDDDSDGKWDRGKLDTNRDDIDDEKWNFKSGRWEKDNGQQIWDGKNWAKP